MAVDIGPALGLTADSKGLQVALPVLKEVRDTAREAQTAAEGLAKGAGKAAAAEAKLGAASAKAAADTVKLANGLQLSTVAAVAEARAQAARTQAALSAARSSGTATAADIKAAQAARDLAAAHRDAANAALLAEKAALTQGQAQVDATTRATAGVNNLSNSSMHTANVFAQANDIVLMAVSGQSPMMLAMQQGMQLNQVWASMGGNLKNIGSIIGSSFLMMLNPINLATIAIIAGGTALVQWVMSSSDASEKTDQLVERLGNLASAATEYQSAIENAQQSRLQLIAEYGAQADAAERLYDIEVRMREFDLIDEMRASQSGLATQFADIQAYVDTAALGLERWSRALSAVNPDFEQVANYAEMAALGIDGLKDQFGMTLPQAQALLRTTQAMATAEGPHQMAMATIEFAEQLVKARTEGAKVPPEMMRVANEAATAAGEILRMAGALQQASDIASSIVIPLGMTSGGTDWLSGFSGAELLPTNPRGSSAPPRVGGGGGGGKSERQTNLEGLIAELQTERETLTVWYNEKLALIQSYSDMELKALGGKNAAIERLEAEHKMRLRDLNDQGNAHVLDAQRAMYSELGSLLGMFAGKSRAAAIASIAINTALTMAQTAQNIAGAQARALFELGPIAGPPAAAKIAAFGKIQMALIAAAGAAQGLGGGGRGGGSSGGSTGGGGATAPAAQQAGPQDVILDFSATADPVMRALAQALMPGIITGLQKASKTGVVIRGVKY